jgi:hypothetical protein
VKVGNQRAESVRDIGVGYAREEGTMVISLAPNESTREWGQRRSRLAENGSQGHFSESQRE